MKKIIEKCKKADKPWKIEWIILGFLIVFCYLSFNHGDIRATATHGMDLLVIGLKGKFFQFYDYTESTAVYLIPIYILFAIWSIPVYIIYGIAGIPIWGKLNYLGFPFPVLMWYKLLPTLFVVGTAIVLYKIGKIIGMSKTKRNWMMLLFASFPILMFSQFCFGQYDSICMFFTMLSIYYYLQKKLYKFSALMSLAITFKLFPIMLFIPLLLYVEKRVFHLIKYCLIGSLGYILSNAFFFKSEGFIQTKTFSTDMVSRFFTANIPTTFGSVSVILVFLIIVCALAYIKKCNEQNDFEFYQNSIYICFSVYSILFAFILWHPQWLILVSPFIILMAMMSENIKTSIILNIIMAISYFLITISFFATNVDESLLNFGIWPILTNLPNVDGGHFSHFVHRISVLDNSLFITIFAGALIANLIIKYPTKKRLEQRKSLLKEEGIAVERGFVWLQIVTILFYVIPSLVIFF